MMMAEAVAEVAAGKTADNTATAATAEQAGLSSLVERSRQALLSRFGESVPDLAAELAQVPTSVAVMDGDAVVDIDLGQTRLYRDDGRAVAEAQVSSYLERPLRFFVNNLRGSNGGAGLSRRMTDFLAKECKGLGLEIADLDVKPDYQGSYLVMLGVGLGFHLQKLIKETKVRHVFLVEPTPELLRHSMAAIDWEKLLTDGEARGITFSLSTASHPDRIISEIQGMFVMEGTPFIDGAFVFLHYPLWALKEARKRLADGLQTLYLSRGFYEDELLMMTNATNNLKDHSFYLMDGKLLPKRKESVFIIGSGPSIDDSLQYIKRWRDHAIVFSCGTSLRVCLKNGIVPDFHCEIENAEITYDIARSTRDEFGFSGITLISTLTGDARIAELFDQTCFFFRDSVSSTHVLTDGTITIRGASPCVANTGLRCAGAMGFSNFYFFGVDCGTKSADRKHARDSVYHTLDTMIAFDSSHRFPDNVRGNFGGTVKTNWIYNFSRVLLSSYLGYYQANAYNCSDGAFINGALPKVAASIDFKGPVLDHAAIKQSIFDCLRHYEPREYLKPYLEIDLADNARRFYEDIIALIDQAIEEDKDFVVFWRRLTAFTNHLKNKYHGVDNIPIETSLSLPKIGMFFVHRVPDPEARAIVFSAFLAEYRRIHEFMRDGTLALLSDVTDRIKCTE